MPTARIFLPPGTYTGVGIAGGTVPALTSGSIVNSSPVAVDDVLTVTGSNAGTGATFQWNFNGVAIDGATSATYTVRSQDAGGTLTRTVSWGDKQTPATTAGVTVASAAYTRPAYVASSTVQMATTSTAVRTASSITIPEGTAYILVAYETGHRTISSVTFNGNSCSEVYFARPLGTSLGNVSLGAYKIEVGSGGATGDIVVTASGDLLSARCFCAAWGGGVNVAEGTAASGTADLGASDTTIDIDVTTLSGDDAISILCANDNGYQITPASGFTNRGDFPFSGARKRAFAHDATGLSAGSPLNVDFEVFNSGSGTIKLAGMVLPLRGA